MRLPNRLPYEILVITSLMITGCSNAAGMSEDHISDIASDAADSAIDDSEKIGALETKLAEAEAKAEDLEIRLSTAEQQVAEIDSVQRRITELESRLSM